MTYSKHLLYFIFETHFIQFLNHAIAFYFQDVYDVDFTKKVYGSPIVSYEELKTGKITHDGDVRIQYRTKDTFKRTAKMLGLMDDFRVSNFCYYVC